MKTILLSISFDFDFLPLFVVASVAWLVPMLLNIFKLKKIPAVIVEIILGYFVGMYFLGSPDQDSYHILEFLALSGFIFLMFLSGLEIDVDQIIASFPRKKLTVSRFLKNPLLVGLTSFLITLMLSYIGALSLSSFTTINSHWYFALIMVTTSVGIILPVLKNRGEISSRFGQMMIIAAAIADILSIILFTFTAFILKHGFKLKILLIVALFVAFFIFYEIGKRLFKFPLFKKISFQLSHAASQISVRGTMLLILIFVVLSQYIGEEVILLGAFLSGLLLSNFLHKERSLLMIKLDGMGFGFFIPIFFIMVGAKFEPDAFKEFDQSLIFFLIFLLITLFTVKIIPSFLWARLFGTRKAISGGFLMSSRLSLIIAAAAIGLDLGVISPGLNASFVLMAVVTCFLSPLIYNQLNPPDILEGEKTVIIGGSSTSVLLARRLHIHGKAAIIIEMNESRCKDIKSKGLNVIRGDGLNLDIYSKIKLKPENYVVVDTASDERNIKICELLRNEIGHERIISKAGHLSLDRAMKKLEVETVDAVKVIATTIENLIIRPTTYHTLVESFENFSVEEIHIRSKAIDGLQVKEIPFHSNAILMMIKRANESYIPHGETYLRLGDVVHIFGTDTALENARKKLSKP
jgi:Kef-type K+ transport system membrane component KefB